MTVRYTCCAICRRADQRPSRTSATIGKRSGTGNTTPSPSHPVPTFIASAQQHGRSLSGMHIPRSITVPALTLTLLFAACAEEPANDVKIAAPAAETVITPSTPVDPVQVQPATAAVSDPNPAHGTPGHRCEIPVGASLSTAPAPGSSPSPAMQQPAITTSIPAAPAVGTNNVVTPAGMNPPHGQPGHDCAVPVGSPLPK